MINCPVCKNQIPEIIVNCHFCGKELNATAKIRKLVAELEDSKAKGKIFHKRLNEMNLLFSKVVKWNYNQRFRFRRKSFKELNDLIHEWQKEKQHGKT
jgi:hypothetical protein